jgi:hypothetical protein
MCSKSGGSPPVPNATSTAFQSATAPSAFTQPYYQQYIQNASQLAGTPFNPGMLGSVAPLNPNQLEAGGDIQSIMQNFPSAVAPVVQAGAQMGQFDPNAVTSIMSPFTQDVTQATQNWFNNQNAQQGNQLLSGAIQSGNAFGGDRAGVAEAQLAGQQQLAQAPVIAGLQQAGYTQALNEYNQLKQMGLAGAQAGLGATLAQLQPATAAMQWGTQAQQQQQRELDVAQQNQMMASAYPFQIQNWYGSALGGMGPLLGSFSQGYTTPPPPSALTQATGLVTALGGLGTSIFGTSGTPGQKRGGPVYKVGGLVRMRNGGLAMMPIAGLRRGPRPLRAGGLVRLRRGGFVPHFQGGGFLGDGTYVSGGGDQGDTTVSVAPQQRRPSFDLAGSGFGRLSLPQYRGGGGPPQADVSGMMSAAMKAAKSTTPDNTLAGTVKNAAGLVTAGSKLFSLLERGGSVHGYDNGGDVDDDDTTPVAALPPSADAVPTPRARPPEASPVPSAETADLPAMGTPGATADQPSELQRRVQAQNPSVEDEETAAAVEAKPQSFETPRRGYQPVVAGPGGARTIAGAGGAPRNFAERLAANPLWNAGIAMLGSRSPYFGEGLSAGMQAATNAIERGRQEREGLLDKNPKIIDDGKNLYRMVNGKPVPTGLTSPKARGRAGPAGANPDVRIRQYTLDHLKSLKDDDEWYNKPGPQQLQEAQKRARQQWNEEHPDQAVTTRDAPPEAPAAAGTAGTAAASAEAPPPMTITSQSAPPPTAGTATQAATPFTPAFLTPEEEADRIKSSVELAEGERFKTPNPMSERELGGNTAAQFDHMALQVAWGRPVRDFASGAGSGPFRKALQARAAQFWLDHNVQPEMAMAMVQKYAAHQAGARTLAIQDARLTNAIQEVKGTAQQVLDISDKIPRTNYPALNNIILAAQKHTGGENVVRLGTAVETLVNDYAATLGRGNSQTTDSARQHAREMLERGYSQGQMRATVDQMLIEIDRASASIRKGMDIYLGLRKEPAYKPGDVLKPPAAGGGAGGAGGGGASETRVFQGRQWQLKPGTDRTKKENWIDTGPAQ